MLKLILCIRWQCALQNQASDGVMVQKRTEQLFTFKADKSLDRRYLLTFKSRWAMSFVCRNFNARQIS